jgi:hypothetical protein
MRFFILFMCCAYGLSAASSIIALSRGEIRQRPPMTRPVLAVTLVMQLSLLAWAALLLMGVW